MDIFGSLLITKRNEFANALAVKIRMIGRSRLPLGVRPLRYG